MSDNPVTPEYVIKNFAMAFLVMVRVPARHLRPELSQLLIEVGKDDMDWPDQETRVRLATPPPAHISAMDEVSLWLRFIPNQVERRIVVLRSITSKDGYPALSWRALGRKFGRHHETIETWHAKAIQRVVVALNQGRANFVPERKIADGYNISNMDPADIGKRR